MLSLGHSGIDSLCVRLGLSPRVLPEAALCLLADEEEGATGKASISSPSLAEVSSLLEVSLVDLWIDFKSRGSPSFGVRHVLWVPMGRHNSVPGSGGREQGLKGSP